MSIIMTLVAASLYSVIMFFYVLFKIGDIPLALMLGLLPIASWLLVGTLLFLARDDIDDDEQTDNEHA